MNDFSTLGKRIKYGLLKEGKSQADLSRYTRIKTATVSQWCSDKVKTLKSDNALKVSRFLKVNCDWLVSGKGAPDAEDVKGLPDDVECDDHYIQVQEYKIECGAGPGTEPSYIEIEDVQPATYRLSYFTLRNLKPSNCKRFTVHGDSMQPTLFNGDKILVNTDDNTSISNNHVYAICVNNEIRVKRLIKQMNGDLIIRSDNKAYPDEVIYHNDESVYFHIIGRVIEKAGDGGL